MTGHERYEDVVHQYVAGTLPDDELEAFEQHLLACAVCRSAVRVGASARVILVRQPKVGPPAWHGRLSWLGGVAAAAVIALLLLRPSDDPLGRVKAAPFVGGALRSSFDPATALVDSGMAAYVADDFDGAAERLGRAARTDSSAPIAFYLGVALLMSGDAHAALDALGRSTIGAYADETAYYMAKALVRLNRADSAAAVLHRAAAASATPGMLRAFADSIRRR